MSREPGRCFFIQGREDGTLDRAARKKAGQGHTMQTEKERKRERSGNNQSGCQVYGLNTWENGTKKWERNHFEGTDPTHIPLDLYVSILVWRGAAVNFF